MPESSTPFDPSWNGDCPPGRCAICNCSGGGHRLWCKWHPQTDVGFTTERGVSQVPRTSAQRYAGLAVGSGDVCGPAAPPSLDEHGRLPCERHPEPATALPTNPLARKHIPLASGLLDYFPAALAAVAVLSQIGNEQHNPGKPMYWNRAKSGDEADALLRHLAERGTIDTDGQRHSVKVAWRALALLQKELEAEGLAPMAPGARPE